MQIENSMLTTAFELPGYRITCNLGMARGIVVRSRSIIGTIGGGLQTIFGGNITLFTSLCERARADALDLMLKHAAEMGANAVVGVRYDATGIGGGITEVLAYGTAVMVEKNR
ncbi:MAG TPA: YbjQ family protein [Candidatus Paceibacterota bacterium]|nr:YbjQ family protein [Candidatus Paceibacterota bacterium]